MSEINDIVDSFNVGFFTTKISTKEPVNLKVNKPKELEDFNDIMNVISTEAYTPPSSKYVQLDGFTFDENNNRIPTKITLEGVYAQDSFLDENGNWDVKAEATAYKERELAHRKEFIDNWIKDNGYGELENTAQLMKALLAKTES